MRKLNNIFKLFLAANLLLLVAACGKENVSNDNVIVNLSGFMESHGDIDGKDAVAAKATLAEYGNIQAVTLAFYNSSNQRVFNQTHLRADYADNINGFCRFSASLRPGDYRMVAVAYKNEAPLSLNSPTEAVLSTPCRETFCLSEDFQVTSTGTQYYSKELKRIVTRLIIRSTDSIPVNVTKLILHFGSGDDDSFNPSTGMATVDAGFTSEVELNPNYRKVGVQKDFFLAADQESVGISYEALNNAGDVLYSKDLGSFSFQRNKVTQLKGPMFSAMEIGDFTVDIAWISDTNFHTFK